MEISRQDFEALNYSKRDCGALMCASISRKWTEYWLRTFSNSADPAVPMKEQIPWEFQPNKQEPNYLSSILRCGF
jgi:hypothetical protein